MQRINNNGLAAAGGGGHSACASCKHQRKKCDQNCVLAEYFPANKNEEFQAVHKIFGVANVTRMIKNAREEDRKRIADSLIWEAICRQRDPILGSYGEYAKVFNELKDLKFKLQVQNQALQQVQGTEQTAWNNGTNGINKGVLAINNTVCSYYNIHGNGNSMYDRSSRLINYSQNFDELKEDRDMVSVLVAVQQQQQQQQQHQTQQRSHGVFDPHYCLPGNQWQRTP